MTCHVTYTAVIYDDACSATSKVVMVKQTYLLYSYPRPRLKNIDRSRIIRSQDITVNNVTVNITEYPLLYSDSE